MTDTLTLPVDAKARPGHCETAPGHASRTLTFWRVSYTAHGSADYQTTPLQSLAAVRTHIAWLTETRGATGITVQEYTLTETCHDTDPDRI